MTAKTRRPRKNAKTTEERRAELLALRERVEEFESDEDEASLAAIFALHDGYSERNAMLIAMQMPEATDVSGFQAWRDRGRVVRKGEHGIQILAPAGKRDAEPATETTAAVDERMFFRIAYVFDVSQTETIEAAKARHEAERIEREAAEQLAMAEDMQAMRV